MKWIACPVCDGRAFWQRDEVVCGSCNMTWDRDGQPKGHFVLEYVHELFDESTAAQSDEALLREYGLTRGEAVEA